MKLIHALAALAVTVALPVFAAPNEDEAIKLAKDSGCTKCHAVDKTKKGPSFQKTAAKYKGKAEGEQEVTKMITVSKKVKLEDGTEEDHKEVKNKDPEKVKNLVQWILSQ